jgi:hypothetical protein
MGQIQDNRIVFWTAIALFASTTAVTAAVMVIQKLAPAIADAWALMYGKWLATHETSWAAEREKMAFQLQQSMTELSSCRKSLEDALGDLERDGRAYAALSVRVSGLEASLEKKDAQLAERDERVRELTKELGEMAVGVLVWLGEISDGRRSPPPPGFPFPNLHPPGPDAPGPADGPPPVPPPPPPTPQPPPAPTAEAGPGIAPGGPPP